MARKRWPYRLTGLSRILRMGLIVAGIAAIALATPMAVLYSVRELLQSLSEVESIYAVDIKALSVQGELQFQIQESRRCFLEELIGAGGNAQRLASVDRARQADLRVSLLTGEATLLTGDGKRFAAFTRAWEEYLETRDDAIALSLQGRLPEAMAIEHARGRLAFGNASEAVRAVKRRLEASSARKVQKVWGTIKRAAFEVLGLLIVSGLFVAGLLAGEVRRRRIVRELRTAVRAIAESEARFRNMFESTSVGILVLDADSRIMSVNAAVTDITGYSAVELAGHEISMLAAEDQHRASAEAIAGLLCGETSAYRVERRIVRKGGSHGWVRASVSVLRPAGRPPEIVVLCEDILEQKLAREQLRQQATHDSLTNLCNRRHFEILLEAALVSAHEDRTELSLLYIDLDGFKLVNDTLGHRVGDEVLREVAGRLQACAGGEGCVARMGGDEFTIIQPHGRDGEAAPYAARRLAGAILEALKKPFMVNSQPITLGASIGIGQYPEDGLTADELIQSADTAMYHAKKSGKQGFFVFDAGLQYDSIRRLRVETRLRHALRDGDLTVVFQPLYDAATGALVRFEALCRWRNDELGDVPPAEFIPVAEESGMIGRIGEWVLGEACREARRWQMEDHPGIGVAVNVSAVQFASPCFVEQVAEVVASSCLPTALLELELTETALLRDRAGAIEKMHQLRAMGIRISLDDFGTGFSSLSYLQHLPVDKLKIDRSFTSTIETDQACRSMVRSLVAMSRMLGLRVTLEGVETEGQMEIARQLGCHEVQGYLLGKPESADAALLRVSRGAPVEELQPA